MIMNWNERIERMGSFIGRYYKEVPRENHVWGKENITQHAFIAVVNDDDLVITYIETIGKKGYTYDTMQPINYVVYYDTKENIYRKE